MPMALAVRLVLCDAPAVKRIALLAVLATLSAGPFLHNVAGQATSPKRITRGLPTSSPDPSAPGGGRPGAPGPAPGRPAAPPTTQVIVSTNGAAPVQKTD